MKTINYVLVVPLLGIVLANPILAGEKTGPNLFRFHGCINCHGAEGKRPVSKVIPELAGKPADELYNKAKIILSGEASTKESHIMHAAFYSPQQCDHPPTNEELRAITKWLSGV